VSIRGGALCLFSIICQTIHTQIVHMQSCMLLIINTCQQNVLMLRKNDLNGLISIKPNEFALKILVLYLYTLIIGHKLFYMLSIRNEVTLQKELQIMCSGQTGNTTTTIKHKIKQRNPCLRRELNSGPLESEADVLPLEPRVNLKHRLLSNYIINCFNAMGRNVNKQIRICGPHIFHKFMFSVIVYHAWITTFARLSYLRE